MPRRRRLNIPLIKGIVMALSTAALGGLSAFTGIGTQVAAAPFTRFMLGSTPERAGALAMVTAVVAAVAGAAGAARMGVAINVALVIVVTIGATIGALLGAVPAARRMPALRRAGPALGIVLSIYVLSEGIRRPIGGPPQVAVPALQTAAGLAAAAAVAGGLARLFQISAGIALVPVAVFIAGAQVGEAIVASLLVTVVAGLLPLAGYTARGLFDPVMARWMSLGAALGGWGGGALLGSYAGTSAATPLIAFGIVTMVLCGWELSGQSPASSPPLEEPKV